jgi:hypothetical protein
MGKRPGARPAIGEKQRLTKRSAHLAQTASNAAARVRWCIDRFAHRHTATSHLCPAIRLPVCAPFTWRCGRR